MEEKLTYKLKKSKENAVRFTANSVNVNFYYETTKNIWKSKFIAIIRYEICI